MADGAGTPDLVKEAQAAAAEAGREAESEVLDEARRQRAAGRGAKSRPTSAAAPAAAAGKWQEFVVDVWITDLNSIEFGFYKRSRNKAKSRQFTSDMDIFAEVIEGGERTGLIGYREDLWKNNTGMNKRLVFKLFGEKVNWRATMDLMIGRSLQLTLGARGVPVVAYSINVGDHDHMVYLERSANKWPLMPEHYSFFLVEDGKPKFYRLAQDLIDVGGDYTLYDERDRVIGRLDGRIFSIGGWWKGRVLKQHADKRLLMVLKLFCGMLSFNRDCRRLMKRIAREVVAGRYEPKLEKQEADLYMNPRRVR